jgi:limonene-1,2-epoxide hydrolase
MTVAKSFIGALLEGDVERVLSFFTEKAEYHDLLLGSFHGKAELRPLFEKMMAECQGLVMTIDRVGTGPGVEFAEWTSTYTVGDSVPQAAGSSITMRGVSVLELSDRRCSTYREYFDRGKALVDMGLPPEGVHKVLSRPRRT